jgi:hypothetical protein
MVTVSIAAVDEYAHTSSGVLSYFDGGTPSPLAVFGWSLFILCIVTIAQFLYQRAPMLNLEGSVLRILLVLVPGFLLIISAGIQGYLNFFDLLLILLYFCLFTISLSYSLLHKVGWCIWVVVSSLIFGIIMEYIGGIEGLWVYQFNEPMALFIIFTWVLRTLTILGACSALGVEIHE